MISEGSCDTEDFNGCWKFSFVSGINYIWKYFKIENGYFIVMIFHNITILIKLM